MCCFLCLLQETKSFVNVGSVMLDVTGPGVHEEIRLEVVRMADPGEAIFDPLEVIRFSWRPRHNAVVPTPTPSIIPSSINAATRETVESIKESNVVPYQSKKLPFKNPIVHQQLKMTPAWVSNPSYFDPCETEGVWHHAQECGLHYSYFLD